MKKHPTLLVIKEIHAKTTMMPLPTYWDGCVNLNNRWRDILQRQCIYLGMNAAVGMHVGVSKGSHQLITITSNFKDQ
jgi:hypothetical protein